MDDLTQAADDVLAERARQKAVEGWTPEHDDAHVDGEIARAAANYAWIASVADDMRQDFGPDAAPWSWPWGPDWWKPADRRRDLVKAGALILAEIERLDRAGLAQERTEDLLCCNCGGPLFADEVCDCMSAPTEDPGHGQG